MPGMMKVKCCTSRREYFVAIKIQILHLRTFNNMENSEFHVKTQI